MLSILKPGIYHFDLDRYSNEISERIVVEKDFSVMAFKDVRWARASIYQVQQNGSRVLLETSAKINIDAHESLERAFKAKSSIFFSGYENWFAYARARPFFGSPLYQSYDYDFSMDAPFVYHNYKILMPNGTVYFTRPLTYAEFQSFFNV